VRSQTDLSSGSKEDSDQARMAFYGFTDINTLEAHLHKARGEIEDYNEKYCPPEVAEFYTPNPLELRDPPNIQPSLPEEAAAFRQNYLGTIKPNILRYRISLSSTGSSKYQADISYQETLASVDKEKEARHTAHKLHDELLHSHSALDPSES
jgi:hypothetical protein